MFRRAASPLIGLGIPFVAIVVVLPFVSDTTIRVFGVPFLFFWIFLWFPLTSLCLAIAWFCFDRKDYDDDDGQRR